IRPIGVVSKNDIGAPNIELVNAVCIDLLATKPKFVTRTVRQNVKIAITHLRKIKSFAVSVVQKLQ
ncbi:MAG: hypothetical protein VW916_06185, partial [Flavobacteriaceae bacterium]